MEVYVTLFVVIYIWVILAFDILPTVILRKALASKEISTGKQWIYSLLTALAIFTLSLVAWLTVFVPYMDATDCDNYMYIVIDNPSGFGTLSFKIIELLKYLLFGSSAISFLWIKIFAFSKKPPENS